MTDVSIEGHERLTVPHKERSWLGYIWGTVGGALFLTMAMILVVAYVGLRPASADPVFPWRGDPGVLTTRAPAAVVPPGGSAADRFNAPFESGAVAPVAPKSRFGVQYTWSPRLHERHNKQQDLIIAEGGFTTHKGMLGTYLPFVPDPSDAFMNVGVQAAMENTGKDYPASVRLVEAALAKAKKCVVTFGMDYPCSSSAGGVTFDFGQAVFSIQVPPLTAIRTGRAVPLKDWEYVARETQDGMYPTAAFNRAAAAEPDHRVDEGSGAVVTSSRAAKKANAVSRAGYLIPPIDASPISIVDFLMKTDSVDLQWINERPAMRRVLSRGLFDMWKRADASAKARDSSFFDGNWVTDTLDFSPSPWEAHAKPENMVTADMTGVDGAVRHATFVFVLEKGSWKVADVLYDGFETTPQGMKWRRSILHYCEEEIGRQFVPLADTAGRLTSPLRVDGLDVDKMVLRGEHGTTYDHNGSEVVVFEKAGLVVYDRPKASIAGTLKKGDVLFSGRISDALVEGTAYTFKAGCYPAPYKVKGSWDHGTMILSGAAPVPEKGSCAINGYSNSCPNARLLIKETIGDL